MNFKEGARELDHVVRRNVIPASVRRFSEYWIKTVKIWMMTLKINPKDTLYIDKFLVLISFHGQCEDHYMFCCIHFVLFDYLWICSGTRSTRSTHKENMKLRRVHAFTTCTVYLICPVLLDMKHISHLHMGQFDTYDRVYYSDLSLMNKEKVKKRLNQWQVHLLTGLHFSEGETLNRCSSIFLL